MSINKYHGICTSGMMWGLVSLGGGCGGDDTPVIATPPLEFTSCMADTVTENGEQRTLYGIEGTVCATIKRPVLLSQPDGDNIDIVTWKLPSQAPHKGSVLMLDGGPGDSGAIFISAPLMDLSSKMRDAGWDLIVPNHRGTGRSTPLSCSVVIDTFAAGQKCNTELSAKWGAGLGGFGPTEAASDVCATIKGLRASGETSIALYGASYGTFWAHNIVALCPEELNFVIVDGNMPAMQADTFTQGPSVEGDFFTRLLDKCSADPTCKSAFAGDPVRAFKESSALADSNSLCPAITPTLTTGIFNSIVVGGIKVSDQGPLLVMSLLKRMQRCSAQDATLLSGLFQGVGIGAPRVENADTFKFTNTVLTHVDRCLLARAYGPQISGDSARQLEAMQLHTLHGLSDLRDECNDFPITEYPRQTAVDSNTPMLFLQGEFDPNTTLAWAKLAAAPYANKTFAVFPTGNHVVGVSKNPSATCAQTMALSFLNGALDQRCLATLAPLDFAGSTSDGKALMMQLFGSPNPYQP
jgi:pimeloyl-ACP methyl ester carboxylesterase